LNNSFNVASNPWQE